VGKSLGIFDDLLAVARAPIYITSAAAGTVPRFPFPQSSNASSTTTACQCLIALFLLGVAVPVVIARQCLDELDVQLLMDLGLVCHCEHDNSLLIAVVSIMPVELGPTNNADENNHVFVVTDWHPRVLNAIQITKDEQAVMYIGPDSLALVQHWILHPDFVIPCSTRDSSRRVLLLDLCTGSGIQALAALVTGKCDHAVCVDTNPRALRFAAFSAALNGLADDSVTLVKGDLVKGVGQMYSNVCESDTGRVEPELPLTELLRGLTREQSSQRTSFGDGYDMVTANPPFLPVPAADAKASTTTATREKARSANVRLNDRTTTVTARHGLFSAGGSSGEVVLAACLRLSCELLKPEGYAAIVSEFFFRKKADKTGKTDQVDHLSRRLQSYWEGSHLERDTWSTGYSKGLLLTNQFPISAALYAERRSDSIEEVAVWNEHLDRENVASCSPGLLHVQKTTKPLEDDKENVWTHVSVPKTDRGSIWTPSNRDAIVFTQLMSRDVFFSHPA